MLMLDRETAQLHAARTDFIWFQSFQLADGIYTPGPQPIEALLALMDLPESLEGMSVLDIGTSNGAVAFALEQRGASRVLGVDIVDENYFGFAATRELLASRAQFMQASIYELPQRLHGEQFDIVAFFGVLYHLRHPLLALDNLRLLAKDLVFIETAVCDGDSPDAAEQPVARFFRFDELDGDGTNWFAPSTACLAEWCRSAGFEFERPIAWPEDAPERALVRATVAEGTPEYLRVSYEHPLAVKVLDRPGEPRPGRLARLLHSRGH